MLYSSRFVLFAKTLTLGALALGLVACTTATPQLPSAQPIASPIPTDAALPTATATTAVSRVVALTSLSADIIHRLDRSKLVGISGSRLLRQNPDLAKLPAVSEGQTPPNLEKILALKPDLVVGATGFHDGVLARLQASGVKTMATQVTSWQSLSNLTRTLATAMQADPDPLLQTYQQCLDPARDRTTKPDQSTLILVSYQPILTPNKTSWAGDLLNQLQINNLAADLQGQSPQRGYITLSPEKILASNPDRLILVDVGDGTVDQLKAAPFWRQLNAVTNNRVYTLDYYGLVNPGSIEAIATACAKLHAIATASS